MNFKAVKRLAVAGMILAAPLFIAAIVFFYTAIWTHGDSSARVGGTGFLSLVLGVILGGISLFAWDDADTKEKKAAKKERAGE